MSGCRRGRGPRALFDPSARVTGPYRLRAYEVGGLQVRQRFVLGSALLVAATFAVVPAPPAWAYDIDTRDASANRSRIFHAFEDDSGTIFEIFFTTTTPNEQRRIRGLLKMVMPSTASDVMLVSRHTVYCAPAASTATDNRIFGVQNVLRGRSIRMIPRYIFTAAEPGDYHCWMGISTGRPRPTSTNQTSNILRVDWGSYLEATTAIHPSSAQGFAPKEPSPVFGGGESYDAAVLTWTAPADVSTIAVSGDAYLTTCTSVGGSLDPFLDPVIDPVTGLHLCTAIKTGGTVVNTRLVVGQRNTAGTGYCQLTYFPSPSGRQTLITKDVHHVVLFQSGNVPISTASDCSRDFKIKVLVKHVSGADVIVHKQGTITAVIPPAPAVMMSQPVDSSAVATSR